jgi:hypothetical protein
MNCKDFDNAIHELVSRRLADKTKQLDALEHAGHCLWCALRLDEETKLTEKLHAFAGTLQSQRAPARVEEELLRAFRERNVGSSAPLFGLDKKRVWRGLRLGLAFAAAVAAVWVVVSLWPRLHPGSSALHSRVSNNRAPATSEPTRSNVAPAQLTGGTAFTSRKSGGVQPLGQAWSPERVALDESANEVATDFISLGTCDDSQCMEEATLVRVRLPVEAALAFGFGTDREYSSEGFVQADVALASGGVPFAIRFVN